MVEFSASLVDHRRQVEVVVLRNLDIATKASSSTIVKLAVTLETHQRVKDLGSAAVPRCTKLRVTLEHPLKAKDLSSAHRQLLQIKKQNRQILQQ